MVDNAVFSIEEEFQEKPKEGSSSVEVSERTSNVANETISSKESINKLDVDQQLCVIHIFRKFQISIKKPLIPLRMALFLWYGAAPSPVAYLSVFLKQKGLSLVQYSSMFSVAFVFQFLTSFLSGIFADKIGNAKPVLIFHILVTILMILTFLCTPGIGTCESFPNNNTQSCKESNYSNITGQDEDINKTFQILLNNVVQLNETNFSNYKYFLKNFPPNRTDLMEEEYKKNFIAVNAKDFSNKCESRKKILFLVHAIATQAYLSSCSAVYHFLDVTVMSLVQKYNTSFGYERFFSITGNVVVAFITGIVLNYFSSEEEHNYRSVYWFCLAMTCLVLGAVWSIETQIKLPSSNMWKKGLSLIRNIDVLVFVMVTFLLGTFFCFFDSFSLWFLEHISASTAVMGLQQTMNALYGLPFFLTSRWWLKVFGTEILFIFAYFGYIIYGIGYSFLYYPWGCLLIESASAFTYHLLWVAVIVHCHHIAPEELVSTAITTTGAIHFGIGRSSGVVAGGLVMHAVGPRITFRIIAGTSFAAAVLYASYLYCRSSKERVCEK